MGGGGGSSRAVYRLYCVDNWISMELNNDRINDK